MLISYLFRLANGENQSRLRSILIFSFIGLALSSCSSYENQEHYQIYVGETIDIFYSTNSCCYYCVSNLGNLKHVALIEDKTIDNGPENCDGCNSTSAFVFKAVSIGIDTVKLKRVEASTDCEKSDSEPEIYIIEIN